MYTVKKNQNNYIALNTKDIAKKFNGLKLQEP